MPTQRQKIWKYDTYLKPSELYDRLLTLLISVHVGYWAYQTSKGYIKIYNASSRNIEQLITVIIGDKYLDFDPVLDIQIRMYSDPKFHPRQTEHELKRWIGRCLNTIMR